jgi:hypothetical protein
MSPIKQLESPYTKHGSKIDDPEPIFDVGASKQVETSIYPVKGSLDMQWSPSP